MFSFSSTTGNHGFRLKQLVDTVCHPSLESIMVNYPVRINQSLLDNWATQSIEVAELLSLPVHHRESPTPKVAPSAKPDCMAIDFAVIEDNQRLSIKLIEAQSFPGMFHLGLALEDVYGGCNILQRNTAERSSILHRVIRGGVPHESVVMLTQNINTMKTFGDYAIAQHDRDATPVPIGEVYQYRDKWWYLGQRGPVRISRVYSRVMYHKLNPHEKEIIDGLLASPDVSWFSHPSWFYQINKASLHNLSHPTNLRVVPVSHKLIPADLSRWVLKQPDEHSGKGIVIAPTTLDVERANVNCDFLQERVSYAPCVSLHGGAVMCMELRFILLRDPETGEWVPITTCIRTSKDGDTVRAMQSSDQDEGYTVAVHVDEVVPDDKPF